MSFLYLKFAKTLQKHRWGGLCAHDAKSASFSDINLFLTRHTNRPAFLSTEKENKKARHIINL